jgi:uncharacterized membrane protein HdeD (DUF308 family)
MATRAQSAGGTLEAPTGRSVTIWAVVMILLGALAIALPFSAGLGITIFLGWIIVFTGCAHLASAFHSIGASAKAWRILLGLVYIAGGLWIVLQPAIGLLSLTLVVASILLAEGVLLVISFFRLRPMTGSGWILVDGIVTFLLGSLIWFRWPASSVWVIGTLLGINLIMTGFAVLMFSATLRRVAAAVAARTL